MYLNSSTEISGLTFSNSTVAVVRVKAFKCTDFCLRAVLLDSYAFKPVLPIPINCWNSVSYFLDL